MMIKIIVIAVTILLGGGFSASAPAAENYPARAVELYCPYEAGTSMDVMVRLIADIAPKYMGQPMVVVNKPGASGSLAAAEVISGKPDGYKLVSLANLFFASTIHIQKVPFSADDLTPIANFMEYRLCMVVRADSPFKTLKDVIEYARKNPGSLKWSHPGRGTSLHTVALSVFQKAKVQTIDVPFKAELLSSLLGGHVHVGSFPYGLVMESVRAGQIRCLAFYGDHRYKDQPNVPSIAELGFPDAAKLATDAALFVRRNTPEHIKNYLIGVSKQIYDDPRFARLPDMGGEDPKYGGPRVAKESIKRAEEITFPS